MKRIGILLSTTLIALVGLSNCDTGPLQDAVDNFDLVIGLEPINTTGTILLVDATTGEFITENVNLVFGGTNGEDVIDIFSDPMPQMSGTGGVFNFGIDNSVIPSESNPAEVLIEIYDDQNLFLGTVESFVFDEVGSTSYQYALVRASNPPAGIVVGEGTPSTTNENNETTTDITVDLTSSAKIGGFGNGTFAAAGSGVSVQIPAGTRFLDADGNPLTGNISTSATYFDPLEPSSVAKLGPNASNYNEDSSLVIFGAVTLTIKDENGNFASTVDQSNGKIRIGTPGDDGTLTDDDAFIVAFRASLEQLGVPQPVIDAAVALMKRRSGGGVINNRPIGGNLGSGSGLSNPILTGPVQQPGLQAGFDNVENTLGVGAVVPHRDVRIVTDNAISQELNVKVTGVGFGKTFKIKRGATSVDIPKVPTGTYSAEIPLEWAPEGKVTFSATVESGAGPQIINVNVPQKPANFIDATISVSVSCETPGEKIAVTDIPTASIVYRKVGSPATSSRVATNLRWSYDETTRELTGASCQVEDVEQGADYLFTVTLSLDVDETKKYERTITISDTRVVYEEVIDEDICE